MQQRQCQQPMLVYGDGTDLGSIFKRHHRPALASEAAAAIDAYTAAQCGYKIVDRY